MIWKFFKAKLFTSQYPRTTDINMIRDEIDSDSGVVQTSV